MNDIKEISIALFIIMSLIEIIKMLIGRLTPNKNSDRNIEILDRVKRMDELHAPRDSNGIPLWYMPRSWGETQKDIAASLRDVAENQRRTLEIIERLEEKS